MKALNILKKHQFLFIFTILGSFLLFFYFSTINYLRNLPQNLNYVDVIPNDQEKEDPEFHSFLADGYRNWGVYNLDQQNQLTFNGNVKHLLHYNVDNLDLKVWKNEEINAQVILVKKDANQTYDDLTITTSVGDDSNNSIEVNAKFMEFVNARKNRQNDFITPFDQHIADWIKTNAENEYAWTNHLVLPVWITIKTSKDTSAGLHPIAVNVNQGNEKIKTHTINLEVVNQKLPDLKDQNHYKLDLWQKFDKTIEYYQQFEDTPIVVGDEKYFQYLDPYLTHLTNIGEEIFNFEILQDPEFSEIGQDLTLELKEDNLNKYLKRIFSYGFKAISFLSVDNFFDFANFKSFVQTEFKSQELTDKEIKTGFEKSQQVLLNYFAKPNWYEGERPIVYINYDELGIEDFKKAMDDLQALQGDNKVFSIAVDVNYAFWTSDKAIEVLKKVDRLSISYAYLNYLDAKNESKVLAFIADREKNNKFTSVYSCTADYPANFIKSQPSESAFIPLYGMKFNIHNFLRWSYNIWPQDWIDGKGIVESDDPSTTLESGDWYSVYPYEIDPETSEPMNNFLSPRIQLLVYGQQQAIKLEMLKTSGKESDSAQAKKIIDKIQTVFWPDNFQPDWNLYLRNKSKNANVDQQLNLLISELNNIEG